MFESSVLCQAPSQWSTSHGTPSLYSCTRRGTTLQPLILTRVYHPAFGAAAMRQHHSYLMKEKPPGRGTSPSLPSSARALQHAQIKTEDRYLSHRFHYYTTTPLSARGRFSPLQSRGRPVLPLALPCSSGIATVEMPNELSTTALHPQILQLGEKGWHLRFSSRTTSA